MEKKTNIEDCITEVNWREIRKDVQAVNERLAAIIDDFGPSDEYSFIKVRYKYGDKLLSNGEVHLPTSRGLVRYDDSSIPKHIQKKLNYSSVPMGIILTKSVEVFFETEDRCMPSKIYDAGVMFGLWEAFDPPPPNFVKSVWNLSAGGRTVFLLPKISEGISHNKLKLHYKLNSYPPKKLLEHHQVFKDIANSACVKNQWICEIIYFSKEWTIPKQGSFKYLRLQNHLLSDAWGQSYNCRAQMSYNVAWESFSKQVIKRNYKPRANTINLIKHLLAISEGVFPGFIPSNNNENILPAQLIQEAYTEHYQLKNYAPLIMIPHHLKKTGFQCYYSLSFPVQLEYTHNNSDVSVINQLREIKVLLDLLASSMPEENQVEYSFFHTEDDISSDIFKSALAVQQDARIKNELDKFPNTEFCANSKFFKGCIRLKKLAT